MEFEKERCKPSCLQKAVSCSWLFNFWGEHFRICQPISFLQSETFYAGLAADHTLPPMSIPVLGDFQPNSVLNVGQQQLHPFRGRSKSLDTGLQSKKIVSLAYQLPSCFNISDDDSSVHLEPCVHVLSMLCWFYSSHIVCSTYVGILFFYLEAV